jgi:hypothetical protein
MNQVDELVIENEDVFNLCGKEIKRNNEVVFDYDANTITIYDYSNMNATVRVIIINTLEVSAQEQDVNVLDLNDIAVEP